MPSSSNSMPRAQRRFEALGVARVVVNVPLDDVWRERLERVRGIARG
jgi:hypothetical protein